MITGIIIKDGTTRLIIVGSDDVDNAVLKQLNGATVTLVTDNLRVGEKSITNGLMITSNNPKEKPDEPQES